MKHKNNRSKRYRKVKNNAAKRKEARMNKREEDNGLLLLF